VCLLLESMGKFIPFTGLQDRCNEYTTWTLHLRRWFSVMLVSGIKTRRIRKYKTDAVWPMIMYGCSTGCPPIHVSVNSTATSSQNRHWLRGRNIMLRCLDICRIGMIARIRMDSTRARTPPSLLGMERRIA
jgi:hypothetical protein